MRRLILALVPLVVLIGLIVLFAANIDRNPDFVPSVLINKPAPDTVLPPVDGLDRPGFDPATFKGRVTVVNVFASWCIPCRQEHPMIAELGKRADIALVGLNQKDAPENVRAFLAELGDPYAAVGADANGRASIEWGVYGVPETFVVNASGIITYKHTGPISEHSLAASVIPAIEAAKADN